MNTMNPPFKNNKLQFQTQTIIKLENEQNKIDKKRSLTQNQNNQKSQIKIFKKTLLEKYQTERTQQYNLYRKDCLQTTEKGRILVGVPWKNKNRNIIPNIMNQLISFLCKQYKSKKVVTLILKKQTSNQRWNINRFYQYLKLVKENFAHYLNEQDLKTFFVIQFPHSELYSLEQQAFYLKICRICVNYFLRNEVILITSTSSRMNANNRKQHLVGREVLLKIFIQMAAEYRTNDESYSK